MCLLLLSRKHKIIWASQKAATDDEILLANMKLVTTVAGFTHPSFRPTDQNQIDHLANSGVGLDSTIKEEAWICCTQRCIHSSDTPLARGAVRGGWRGCEGVPRPAGSCSLSSMSGVWPRVSGFQSFRRQRKLITVACIHDLVLSAFTHNSCPQEMMVMLIKW